MKRFILIICLLVPALTSASTEKDMVFDFEKDSSVPIVNISMAFRAGAMSDPRDLLGLTHFMGEMMLRGTKQRNKRQLEIRMDELGSSISMDVRSQLFIVRASVLSAKIKPFLELLREVILEPSFPEAEIRKYKSQLISELFSARSHDSYLARLHFAKHLFGDHPLGRPVTGLPSTVRKFTRMAVQNQYHRCLQQGNVILVGTGDVDPEFIRHWGETLMPKLPKYTASATLPPPQETETRRLLIVDKPDRTQHPVIIGQVGIPYTHPEFFKLFVANHAFGGHSFMSRLMTEIRVKRGWSYGAYSSLRPSVDTGEWSFSFSPKTSDLPSALRYGLQMAQQLKDQGITGNELDFSRDALINSSGFMYNTPAKRVENTLIENAIRLPKGFFMSFAGEIQKLERDEINETLKNFISTDKFTIAVVGSAADLKKPLAEASGVPEGKITVRKYNAD